MSYFDKPKKTPVKIHQVENGYLVCIGDDSIRYDAESYIAKDTEISIIVIQALEKAKKQYDDALAKWQEKEDKTAEGYEWQKKREEKKKD